MQSALRWQLFKYFASHSCMRDYLSVLLIEILNKKKRKNLLTYLYQNNQDFGQHNQEDIFAYLKG